MGYSWCCAGNRPRAPVNALAGPSTTLPRINALSDTLPPNSARLPGGNSQQPDELTHKSVSHPLLRSAYAVQRGVHFGRSLIPFERLYEIATRLQSIESALHLRSYASPTDPSRQANVFSHSPDDGDYEMEEQPTLPHIQNRLPRRSGAETGSTHPNGGTNTPTTGGGSGSGVVDFLGPLDTCSTTMERILGKAEVGRVVDDDHSTDYAADYGAPDALRRGILNPDECQELFDFFFNSMHPWVMVSPPSLCRISVAAVRSISSRMSGF